MLMDPASLILIAKFLKELPGTVDSVIEFFDEAKAYFGEDDSDDLKREILIDLSQKKADLDQRADQARLR